MKQVNLYLGGFVATLLITVLMYLSPFAGAPHFDIAALLGSFFGYGHPAAFTGFWWAGMVWHFINGTLIFPLIYSRFVSGWLVVGSNWLRGDIWGIILWLGLGFALLPLAGLGVFGDRMGPPAAYAVTSFVLYVIYGTIFGALAGAQAEQRHHVPHPA